MPHRSIVCISLLASLVLCAGSGHAGVPSQVFSQVPAWINLVPLRDGQPDPIGLCTVKLRDASNNPAEGATVEIDFSGCGGFNVQPSCVQDYAGMTYDSGTRIAQTTSDMNGDAKFLIAGAIVDRSTVKNGICAAIRVNGTEWTRLHLSAYDQDGVNGIEESDWTLMLSDYYALSPYAERSDLNHSGQVNGGDLSLLYPLLLDKDHYTSASRCDGVETLPAPHEAGLNLAWEACLTEGGLSLEEFGCNANDVEFGLVASIVPPTDIEAAIGYDAIVEISGCPQAEVPSWWRLEPGGCRAGNLVAVGSADQISSGSPCGSAQEYWTTWLYFGSGTGVRLNYVPGSPPRVVVRVPGFWLDPAPSHFPAGVEQSLFSIIIYTAKSSGPGACAGCASGVQLTLKSVRVEQAGSYGGKFNAAAYYPDVVFDAPASSNIALAQNPNGSCVITPTRNVTWGRIKTMYR